MSDSKKGRVLQVADRESLVTSVVDYNLGSLYNLLSEGTIDVQPGYQRRFRWDETRQSLLVESFLLNIPVPPIYLSESEEGKYFAIDGQQRLTAIRRFFSGELRLTGLENITEYNKKTIEDLLPGDFRKLQNRSSIRAIIILQKSDEEMRFKVFQRLNAGTEKLNSQEIRNSTFPGSLNDKLHELSRSPRFTKLIGTDKAKEKKTIYRSMRDVEFVLRFFTFHNQWGSFSGLMSINMDRYMRKNRELSGRRLQALEKKFLHAVEVSEAIFGVHAFRRWWPGKSKWDSRVMSALYDATILSCQYFKVDEVQGREAEIIEGYKRLFEDEGFVASIDKATSFNASVRMRVRSLKEAIESSVRQ